jgi:hypothetical protein
VETEAVSEEEIEEDSVVETEEDDQVLVTDLKCTRQLVQNVETWRKFHLNQQETSQYFVLIVSEVEIEIIVLEEMIVGEIEGLETNHELLNQMEDLISQN